MSTENIDVGELVESWVLPSAARLGSSVRGNGIFLEIRARLAAAAKKALSIRAGEVTLRMPVAEAAEFEAASAVVAKTLVGIEDLPVIPREIQDILSISTTERHRWLKDGRLPSAGTRTVKLRGRAKKITFHVFNPRVVEDILDHDLVDMWREEDAERAADNRRRAVWKAKLTRAQKTGKSSTAPGLSAEQDDRFKLEGWAEFEREGPR